MDVGRNDVVPSDTTFSAAFFSLFNPVPEMRTEERSLLTPVLSAQPPARFTCAKC